MKLKLTALACAFLIGCGGAPDLDDPKLSSRNLNLEEFFEGKTVARGQFQDLFGNVQRRFDVNIQGTWDGQTLKLVEDFTYADGSTEQRIWTLKKTGDDTWIGSAPGVIGEAKGEERGDTFNWAYRIDLPGRDGKVMRVDFDDWMWLLSDDRVLNRAYVKKYGITIGEAIIVFEKL
ncbi:DUF3833 domain-containing protein [Aliiroseovarius sp. S1339]|uniref:DUF3833 domain-containing protein n=1 Tax=Aliiroseovarius sp. S1339 TaxID=2936990 RepID=UPI0020BE453E|nr:DUF3833 domain-containing protein [Aliiroseovarius sp. S1339]MCK8464106.1 DUF3833 domain-containing protein [Aliiroseovarius sp. S1339]